MIMPGIISANARSWIVFTWGELRFGIIFGNLGLELAQGIITSFVINSQRSKEKED
jgi:hypothetical protein